MRLLFTSLGRLRDFGLGLVVVFGCWKSCKLRHPGQAICFVNYGILKAPGLALGTRDSFSVMLGTGGGKNACAGTAMLDLNAIYGVLDGPPGSDKGVAFRIRKPWCS